LSTEIGYFIPEGIKISTLYIFDMQGVMLKNYPITKHGQGSTIISGSELKPGMYFYSLVADGKEVDTKRMILTE
jgi:hypothetical protein